MIKLGVGGRVKIDKLKCEDHHLKTIDKDRIEQLKASLLKYGNISPITITPSFWLLDGFARVLIFKDLGINEINTNIVRLNIEDAKKFKLTQSLITTASFDIKTFFDFVTKEKLPKSELEKLGFFVPKENELTDFVHPDQLSIFNLKPTPKVKEIDYSIL